MDSLLLILTSVLFPIFVLSWLCCIGICIYKYVFKNVSRPGRKTRVQVGICLISTQFEMHFLEAKLGSILHRKLQSNTHQMQGQDVLLKEIEYLDAALDGAFLTPCCCKSKMYLGSFKM